MTRQTSRALAALSFQLPPAAGEIQLTPPGPSFRSGDGSGRPVGVAAWRIDAGIARRLIERVAARSEACVIDYEHQTLLTDKNGQPAPAAGWFSALNWREGQGLFATGVEWTPRAAEMLKAGEYRYISPVFEYDARTGEVQDVRMAALTNNPGLSGMQAVALSTALANFDFDQEEEMDLKQLLVALGLPDDTDEAGALAALSALQAKADGAATEVAALKAQQASGESVKDGYKAAVAELQTQVAALTAAQSERELDALLDEAVAAGKPINDGLRATYKKDYAGKVAALKAVLDQTPAVAALRGMQSASVVHTPGAGLTDVDEAARKALGLSPEKYTTGKE
jgi:phage I-like protein